MQPLFITASGTNVGKTLVMTSLCWQLREAGKQVTALKPVISGYNPGDLEHNDTALILRSCGLQPEEKMMETISPWRYSALLAPAMAAGYTGKFVMMDELVAFCREHASLDSDMLLVEGAGGLMAPITNQHTVLDWITQLNWPSLLVVGCYLGAISHALTALGAMLARGIAVKAIVVNECEKGTVGLDETVEMLMHFVPPAMPIIKIPYIRETTERWKYAPPMNWLLEEKP